MSQLNGVAFQFFHWYLDKDDSFQGDRSLWAFLKAEADNLRQIGIDAVWIPPAYKRMFGKYRLLLTFDRITLDRQR